MKNKKVTILISLITIISFIIGVSYAYFTTIVVGNDTASSNVMTSGTLRLTYNGTDYIDMVNKEPGDYDSMTFTVSNTGTLPVSGYDIYFSNVINTFYTKSELVYEIDCTSSDAVTCLDKAQTQVPSASGIFLSQTSIAPGATHTYTLTVTFIDTGLNQDYNQGKTILFDVTINEQYVIPVLTASTGSSDTRYFWGYKTSITSITFEKGIDVPVGAVASWDVSAAQDGSIMAYIMGSTTYDLYIQTESDFLLSNPNGSYLFYNFQNLTLINNISMLRTYYVTTMYNMFRNCSNLTSLDLSTFDTSNVLLMGGMFYNCNNLASLDLSIFDTSKVTNMSFMFYGCTILTSLDFSAFDTSNVISMSYMFEHCSNILNLNLSTFDTSKVTDMAGMFYNCASLTSLNLSAFNTNSVTNMSNMFNYCTGLTSLNLSAFNTNSVTNMSYMFYYCNILTNLDLSTFDTSNVTNMSWIFSSCNSLISLDLSTFDTSKVTDMFAMFNYCNSLTNLNLRNANFTTVTTYTSMFSNITSGITITVKDTAAQTFINARLMDAVKTGTVVIA